MDKKMTVMIKFNDKLIPGEAMKSFMQIFCPKLSDSFEFKLDLKRYDQVYYLEDSDGPSFFKA